MNPLSKSSSNGLEHQHFKLHIVERVEPTRVLRKCFEPLLRIMVPLGILPVHINEIGWATYKFLQLQSAFYLLFLGLFTFVTCIYAPFYLNAMEKMSETFVFEVAKYLFVGGQHLAAAVTLLMVPVLSGRVTKLWNKLQQLVVQITSCHSAKSFARIYRLIRLMLVLWILVVVSSWYLWWNGFAEYFQEYFQSCSGSVTYYLHIFGCITMSTLISSHVLHSIFFISVASMLRMCFHTITRVATEQKCHLQANNAHDHLNEKLNERKVCCELTGAYEKTSKLVANLGSIYGRYMVVQMFAFFSSALTSVFALFSKFYAIQLETVVITLVINLTWFCGMCECGQMVLNEESRCFQSMKAIALKCDMPTNWMIEKFMGVKFHGLTAARYFSFSRKLMTAAVVSLATYLIVMLQFRAADTTNTLIQQTVGKIENLTYNTILKLLNLHQNMSTTTLPPTSTVY